MFTKLITFKQYLELLTEDLKGLEKPAGRFPAKMTMKTNPETGEKRAAGYKAYSPPISDMASHEDWALKKDVARRNEKLAKPASAKALKKRGEKGPMPTLTSYLTARPPREK